ncbi:hypothetical protein [Schinkia azotoformans]|uniref:hypothetical protein n=1 Tax=Schinkia azotoformans TaxID=1454 RepID=UPI002DB95027|nr:hypothetical protein [Schinkia azotoformans]MEC1786083.1 hypothetical protein [Schinkia azotoformans]MED4420119.1 hypothetical protein [Schinkia azotoformans]
MATGTLNNICEIIKCTLNSYGKWTESEPIITDCRVKEEYKKIKNKSAEEVVSKMMFTFSPDTEINFDDSKITYIIRFKGNKYEPISILNKRNTMGDITRKVVYV